MRTPEQVPDHALDLIEPTWTFDEADDRLRGHVASPDGVDPSLALVASVIDVHDHADLLAMAEALVAGNARSWDAGGIARGDDGVLVWDALDRQARTSTPAMARLLARSVTAADDAHPGDRSHASLTSALSELASAET